MRSLRHFILSFYLLGSFFSATHLHPNDPFHTHSDCKICVVAKNISGDAPKQKPLLHDQKEIFHYLYTYSFSPSYSHIKGIFTTAPPLHLL